MKAISPDLSMRNWNEISDSSDYEHLILKISLNERLLKISNKFKNPIKFKNQRAKWDRVITKHSK